MARVVVSLVSIVATIAVLLWCFGITVPQVTSTLPGLNRSVAHTVALMQGGSTGNAREPADTGDGSTPATGAAPAPQNPPAVAPNNTPSSPGATTTRVPAPARSDEAEIIGPDTTSHLNPDHILNVDPSGSNPNPPAFAAPNPLPAQPHWTWDVGNREFNNVVVTHVDADLVTITADSGAAQIDIALLPSEIQRQLNYDPVLAGQAAARRAATPGKP